MLGGGGMLEQSSAVFGGGGTAEEEPSAVTGGGEMIEQDGSAVTGGGGIAEQPAKAVTGGGGIAEQPGSAVTGGGGMIEQDGSAVTGGGGIAEQVGSAVTGGGGILEQDGSAVDGGGGITDPPSTAPGDTIAAERSELSAPGHEYFRTSVNASPSASPESSASHASDSIPSWCARYPDSVTPRFRVTRLRQRMLRRTAGHSRLTGPPTGTGRRAGLRMAVTTCTSYGARCNNHDVPRSVGVAVPGKITARTFRGACYLRCPRPAPRSTSRRGCGRRGTGHGRTPAAHPSGRRRSAPPASTERPRPPRAPRLRVPRP